MCGRFVFRKTQEDLDHWGHWATPGCVDRPRYNIAPGQRVQALVFDQLQGRVSLKWLHWGMKLQSGATCINLRSETVHCKPMFTDLFAARRCILLADGFYEWQSIGRYKQPVLFQQRGHSLFGLAGIWDERQGVVGDPKPTCLILTTKANPMVAKIHSRMPVILEPNQFESWLRKPTNELSPDWNSPLAENKMTLHPVRPWVNKVEIDQPGCIEPYDSEQLQF